MVSLKKIPKKLVAILLSLLMLITAMPTGLFTTVFAASNDYKAVQTGETTIYLYGVTSAEEAKIENGKYIIEYNGGDEIAAGLYVDGTEIEVSAANPEIEYDSYKISLDKVWVESQTAWIAVKCSSTLNIPSSKPLPDIEGIIITPYAAAYDEGTHEVLNIEGIKSGDIITYSENGMDFDLTEVPAISEVGTKDVYVKIERAGYNDYISEKFTAQVTEGTIDWITVAGFDGTYDPADPGVKSAVTINGEDDTRPVTIQYSEDNGVSYTDVMPTIEFPGEKTVKVKITRNNYAELETAVTAKMASAIIEDIEVTVNSKITYDGETHPVVLDNGIDGLKDGDKVFFSTDGINYKEEVPSYSNAGNYDFYIKIQRAYHEDYVTFPSKFTFTIEKAKIENVTAIGYNNTYDRKYHDAITSVNGVKDTDIITYSKDGISYSSINPQVKRKRDTDTYYVKIHRSDNFEDLIIPVEVSIGKMVQNLTFEEVLPQTYKDVDSNTFKVAANSDAEEGHDSRIRYSIVSGNATINSSTGIVEYKSTGTIKIKAETDEGIFTDYQNAAKEISVEVNYTATPQYTITPEQYNTVNYKWYSCEDGIDGFVIQAPEGWNVIKTSNAQGQSGWTTAVEETAEGIYTDYKVAFKNIETNEITDLVSIPNFIIDKTNPEISSFEFEAENTGLLAKAVNSLTFGTFCKEKVKITVNCTDFADKDTSSGIKTIKLYTYDIDGVTEAGEVDADSFDIENGKAVFFIEPNYEGTIKAEVIDNVNRTSGRILATQKNANIGEDESGYMMVENDKPIVSEIITDGPLNADVRKAVVEDKTIYSGDIKFSFSAQDTGSGLYCVDVKVNDISYEKNNDKYPKDFSASQDREKHDFEISTDNLDEKYLKADGSFKIDVTVIDNAGNYIDDRTVTVYKDTTSATIRGYKFSTDKFIDVPGTDNLYKAVEVTDYGFYFKKDVEVTITADDFKSENEIASGVNSISYVAVDINGNRYEERDVPVNDKNEISFPINKDFKGQIYAYATDKVGNTSNNSNLPTSEQYDSSAMITEGAYKGYVHPNGTIVETADKHKDDSKIEFTSIPKAQGTQNNTSNYSYSGEAQKDKTMDFDTAKKVPLYNKDITFGVKVTDTYSGIRELSYTIIEGNEKTVKTTVLNNDGKMDGSAEGWNITKSEDNLVTEMTNTIAVSGNYNDMVLLIELTDRAGNKSYDYYVFGIDKTAPSIEIEYDNNSGDSQSGTGIYFKASRTATITVSERNFNKEAVKFNIKNAEGDVPNVKFVKDIKGTGNGDDTRHVFEVTYSNNGVYSFSMNYTDRAANANSAIDYKNSLAPTSFVVDKTNPTISVSYDNNEAQNDKFFKAHRTATITIVEHNFDVNRVVIKQTSAISGNAISNPSVSWVNSGDIYIGTINYNADGDYTFDITMTDKAGNKEETVNYGSSVAAKDFTIDTMYSDIVKVEGIADKGVLGLENGDINADAKISITINDINLDSYNIKLTRSRVLVTGESDEKPDASQENVIDTPETQCVDNENVTAEFVPNASGSENSTVTIRIPKRNDSGVKNDGLYTLTVEAKDKAGNAYDTNANIITFSVNRFGSVFTFSKGLYDLITKNDGYTQSAAGMDLTVYEYNATTVESDNVEVIANNDSKMLVRDTDYTVVKDMQQTDTSWSKYTYNIKSENFADDGVYTLRISSKDAASITSQTVDYDVCSATFRVDKTPAEIISVNYSTEVNKIAGHDGGSAKAENLAINFTVEDLIRLEKVEVYVNDMENPKYTYQYGKDFDNANTFEPEPIVLERNSEEQIFKIVVTDKAGNVMDTTEGDSNGNAFEPGYAFFDHVTVTTNQFVIWAKSPVFWGMVGSIAVLAIGILIFIVIKKRKKDDNETTNE